MSPTTIDVTVTVAGSLSTIAASCAAILGYINRNKLNNNAAKVDEIKISVDGRLDMALEDIRVLKNELIEAKKSPAEPEAKNGSSNS